MRFNGSLVSVTNKVLVIRQTQLFSSGFWRIFVCLRPSDDSDWHAELQRLTSLRHQRAGHRVGVPLPWVDQWHIGVWAFLGTLRPQRGEWIARLYRGDHCELVERPVRSEWQPESGWIGVHG
jgi:hypothetical protein